MSTLEDSRRKLRDEVHYYQEEMKRREDEVAPKLEDEKNQLQDNLFALKDEMSTRLEAINFYYEDFPGKAALEGFLNKHAPNPYSSNSLKRIGGQRYNEGGPENIDKTRSEYQWGNTPVYKLDITFWEEENKIVVSSEEPSQQYQASFMNRT